jgi:replicative DNA helicase
MKRLACSEKGGNGSNNVYLALSSCYSGLILGTQPIAGVKKVFTSAANTCSLSSPDGSDLPLVLFSNSSISLDDFDQNMLENMSRIVFEKYIAPFIRDDVMKSYGLDDLSDSSIEDMFLRNEPDLTESELQKNVEDFKKDMEIGLNKVFTESWPPLVQDGPAGVCE